MMDIKITKQLLEEQYNTVIMRLGECESCDMFLAQVCYGALLDVMSSDSIYTFEDFTARFVDSERYKDFFHFYSGTIYGQSEDVCERVEESSKDESFLKRMVDHSLSYYSKMEEAA